MLPFFKPKHYNVSMKLLFRQKAFTFFSSYNIFDESGKDIFFIKGKAGLVPKFEIQDAHHHLLGMIMSVPFKLVPHYAIYKNNIKVGEIIKSITFFKPKLELTHKGWRIDGNYMGWDYTIKDNNDHIIATISKELFKLTDTYSIDVVRREDALDAVLVVVAIDAIKASNDMN